MPLFVFLFFVRQCVLKMYGEAEECYIDAKMAIGMTVYALIIGKYLGVYYQKITTKVD